METNIYPHLSSAKSMARYLNGLASGLRNIGATVSEHASIQALNFWRRYPGYLLKALFSRTGNNIILSERFSFLLPVMRRDSTIVVCHDLVALHLDTISYENKFWYKGLLRMMTRAKNIVCISEATRQDLFRFLPGVDRNKVHLIYNGLEPFWSSAKLDPLEDRAFSEKYGMGNFFLMVGTDAWNKNLKAVIEILPEIKRVGARLVKVGAITGNHQKQISTNGMQDVVRHEEDISDAELKWLYQHAIALIFPSFFEGFGWPPLEAMACGCPVIASHTSSVPEVCGDAAWYIDPYRPATIVDAIGSIMNDQKNKEEMIKKGFVQASRFTWEDTARNFIKLFSQ